jgi:hypothetical protein
MPGENNKAIRCSEFETLLFEVIENRVTGKALEIFNDHAKGCANCRLLLAEAQEGHRGLKSLAEIDPPANLIPNILAATTGVPSTHKAPSRWREWMEASIFAPVMAMVKQPRFAMSFGMAFFSLSVGLNVAGVKVSDVRHVDLRPSAIRRTYYETSGKVAKYYENLRFVYEFEARVRELKRVTQPAGQSQEEKENNRKNNTSGQPDQNQERNYSQQGDQPILASFQQAIPVVPVTTRRRLV